MLPPCGQFVQNPDFLPFETAMIIRQQAVKTEQNPESITHFGPYESKRFSDSGGLTQFGTFVMTLQPGSRSSNRHWHENEDEFMYVLSGEVTVVENDGAHVLAPGDAACWPAGTANGHQVVNRSDAPCSFLVAGTRLKQDIVHYPDLARTLYYGDGRWRLENADGSIYKQGLE